ncbi:MAG: ABC transporter substrate-binding protein [Zestosphaera sp.]
MSKRILFSVVILALVVGAGLYVMTRPPSDGGERLRVVVYAYNDVITGIDPSLEDDTGLVVLGVVYEPLLYYNPVTGEFRPALAVNWSSNEDGTEWVFRLRRGVVFHDGVKFNATAVKVSVERAMTIYRETGRGLGYVWDSVDEVEVVDEYTVRFKLNYPQRLDIMASACYAGYIFSPNVLKKSGATDYMDRKLEEWFNSGNAAGTGPYVLESYSPESEVRLRKFKEWWGWGEVSNPKAPDVVIIKVLTEPQAQYNGLLSGVVDIATSVPRANIPALISQGLRTYNLTTYHNYLMFFNVRRHPTSVESFRKAVAHAINLDEAVSVAMGGHALKGSGVLPHGFPGFVEGLTYEYNITKAREYLRESGVPTPARIQVLYQVDYEETRKLAELMQSRLKDLGIEVDLNPATWTQLKDIARSVWDDPEGVPHIIIADWWPTMASPYDYLYAMFHSESKEWNFAGYEDPEFDEMIEKAYELEGLDYQRAMQLYREAQQKIFDEAVALNLWDEVKLFIYGRRVYIPPGAMNPLYMYVIRFEKVSVEGT